MKNLSIVVVMLSGLCFAACGAKPQASAEMKEVAASESWEYLPVGTILTLRKSYEIKPQTRMVFVYQLGYLNDYRKKGVEILLAFPPSDRERVLSAGTKFSLQSTPQASADSYYQIWATVVNSSKTFKVSIHSNSNSKTTIGDLANAFDIQQPQPLVIGN